MKQLFVFLALKLAEIGGFGLILWLIGKVAEKTEIDIFYNGDGFWDTIVSGILFILVVALCLCFVGLVAYFLYVNWNLAGKLIG